MSKITFIQKLGKGIRKISEGIKTNNAQRRRLIELENSERQKRIEALEQQKIKEKKEALKKAFESDSNFNENYLSYEEKQNISKEINKLIPENSTVIDIGTVNNYFQNKKLNVHYCNYLAKPLQRLSVKQKHVFDVEQGIPNKIPKADAITVCFTANYFFNPEKTFQILKNQLKPKGKIIIVGSRNAGWKRLEAHEHSITKYKKILRNIGLEYGGEKQINGIDILLMNK